MSFYGVAEAEWRKVSTSAGAVERIQAKYSRLLQLMAKNANEQAEHVPGLSLVVELSGNTATLTSFAGETHIRLGWDASGEEIAGVAVFTSRKHGAAEPTVILKVYFPAWAGTSFLPLEGGSPVVMDSYRAGDFAYEVLMNVVRKQVDLSNT